MLSLLVCALFFTPLLALARYAPQKYPNRTCRSFYHSIAANATNVQFRLFEPTNQEEYNAIYIAGQESPPFASDPSNGTAEIDGKWDIYFEYCEPKKGITKKSLLLTVHGIVGTAGYWNPIINGSDSLSFVKAATEAGYATLSYDRLGVRHSSKPDGLSVVQASIQLEIMIKIVAGVRKGWLGLGVWKSVVGIGHSFGSTQLVGVAGRSPTIFDGLVLTGIGLNSTDTPLALLNTFGTALASITSQPDFKFLSGSYLTTETQSHDQLGFFSYPNYSRAALDVFTATKGTYTLGEILTITAPLQDPTGWPTNFTGPVFIMNGERDTVICSGNCYDVPASLNVTSKLEVVKTIFPAVPSEDFETYVVPGVGHGINFHTVAPSAYARIVEFLNRKGL